MFVSVQASTSLQIRVCVWNVTAIPWERLSAVVRAGLDSVCVPILQWEGGAVTSVARCSLDSTPAWAGKAQIQSHMHRWTPYLLGVQLLPRLLNHMHTHTHVCVVTPLSTHTSRCGLCKDSLQIGWQTYDLHELRAALTFTAHVSTCRLSLSHTHTQPHTDTHNLKSTHTQMELYEIQTVQCWYRHTPSSSQQGVIADRWSTNCLTRGPLCVCVCVCVCLLTLPDSCIPPCSGCGWDLLTAERDGMMEGGRENNRVIKSLPYKDIKEGKHREEKSGIIKV